MQRKNSVVIGVIGCGYWGPNLIRNFLKTRGVEGVVCCDANVGRLEAVRQLFPQAAATTSYDAVLTDPKVAAVAIATPASTHPTLVQQALLSGKHVFVEKPLAFTVAQCETLIALAASRGLQLMVGHTFLYSPALRKLHEMCSGGMLGAICHMSSQRLSFGRFQVDISALWSLAPHDVSIVNYLMGTSPVEVTASGGSFLTENIHDVVYMTLTYPQGGVAHIHVSWLDPCKVRKLTVAGTHGMAIYDDAATDGKVKVYSRSGSLNGNGHRGLLGPGAGPMPEAEVYVPEISGEEPLALECRHFIESIESGNRPLTDGTNGLETVRVLEAAQASLEQHGAPVQVATPVYSR